MLKIQKSLFQLTFKGLVFPGPPESEGDKKPSEDREDATSAVSDDLELSDEEDSNESKEAGEGKSPRPEESCPHHY